MAWHDSQSGAAAIGRPGAFLEGLPLRRKVRATRRNRAGSLQVKLAKHGQKTYINNFPHEFPSNHVSYPQHIEVDDHAP